MKSRGMSIFQKSMIIVSGLICLSGSIASASAQTNSVTTAFTNIRSSSIWPIPSGTRDAITQTFGPRIQSSTDAYDWHRGVDVRAALGTNVVAPLQGTLFGVKNYADGGLTLILRHSFPSPIIYAGRTLSNYYTFYMHLDSITPSLVTAASAGKTPTVKRGDIIGKVGHSGTAIGDHLHWEVRVGCPYSLEWQLANPSSQYGSNNCGFDPAMHPMLMSPPLTAYSMGLSLLTLPGSEDGRVRYTSDDDYPLLNRVLITIARRSDGAIVGSHTLDFDERTGYNATSDAALNIVDQSKPYMAPRPFFTASPYTTDIVIPRSFVGSAYGAGFETTVQVYDIWGRTKMVSW